jgi:replication factor C large subunit
MLLGVADAAGGKGLSARIMPPERWHKIATAKRLRSIRTSTLNKVAGMMHIPQNTLREQYLGMVSLLVEHDPAGFARILAFDADQLNFFLSDKARSAAIIRTLAQEENTKAKEQEKELHKELQKEKLKEQQKKRTRSIKPGQEPDQAKKEPSPVEEPVLPAEPGKLSAKKTQSTLFDGF